MEWFYLQIVALLENPYPGTRAAFPEFGAGCSATCRWFWLFPQLWKHNQLSATPPPEESADDDGQAMGERSFLLSFPGGLIKQKPSQLLSGCQACQHLPERSGARGWPRRSLLFPTCSSTSCTALPKESGDRTGDFSSWSATDLILQLINSN